MEKKPIKKREKRAFVGTHSGRFTSESDSGEALQKGAFIWRQGDLHEFTSEFCKCSS